jgi:hypothetical protein
MTNDNDELTDEQVDASLRVGARLFQAAAESAANAATTGEGDADASLKVLWIKVTRRLLARGYAREGLMDDLEAEEAEEA